MYAIGQSVPQNNAEAVRWYHKAAEQDIAEAKHNLGFMYYKGWGVLQDYATAADWYRKAAEQGDFRAQLCLGIMYAKGQGVPEDYVEAYKWLTLAVNAGNTNANKVRISLDELISPAQKAKAFKLAREWRVKK